MVLWTYICSLPNQRRNQKLRYEMNQREEDEEDLERDDLPIYIYISICLCTIRSSIIYLHIYLRILRKNEVTNLESSSSDRASLLRLDFDAILNTTNSGCLWKKLWSDNKNDKKNKNGYEEIWTMNITSFIYIERSYYLWRWNWFHQRVIQNNRDRPFLDIHRPKTYGMQ